MPSRRQPLEQLAVPTTVLLTVECRQGVVGKDSALPELAAQAGASGALRNIARLVDAAHEAGVQVLHAVAERRSDGRVQPERAAVQGRRAAAVQQHAGSAALRVAPPIEVGPEDLVVRMLHRLSPLAGTGVDPICATSAATTLVVTGVSGDVAVPAAVFDAVNLGHTAVVVADAIAGVPAECTPAMLRDTLSLVAGIATADEVVSCWKGPRAFTRA